MREPDSSSLAVAFRMEPRKVPIGTLGTAWFRRIAVTGPIRHCSVEFCSWIQERAMAYPIWMTAGGCCQREVLVPVSAPSPGDNNCIADRPSGVRPNAFRYNPRRRPDTWTARAWCLMMPPSPDDSGGVAKPSTGSGQLQSPRGVRARIRVLGLGGAE